MRPVFIYALNNPATGDPRYIGQTIEPDRRLAGHLYNSKRWKHYSANWIRSLLDAGLKPVMEILDVVPDTEADFWEREYIQNFRERGFDLTNGTDGGDTGPSNLGKPHSPEHREKIRAALIGKKRPPEVGAKISASQTGRKYSPDKGIKQAIAIVKRSKPFSNSTSGYSGVTFSKACRKWAARVKVKGVNHHLGVYNDKYDAVFVRRLAVEKYFVQ